MFVNTFNYNISMFDIDKSLHDGVPREFYDIKDKKFGDWEIPPWELFIFENRLLGEGSFAKVYLAKWRETMVVAKVINKNICEEEKDLVLREFDIMTKLHHPNIVQFLGYIDNPLIIVMEYIPNGNLLENIEKRKLTKKNKKNIMKDILQGISYIHNRRPYSLIHRDIKPTNILLTKSKVAKITDFGLSKFYKINRMSSPLTLNELDSSSHDLNTNLDNSEFTKNVGTQRYMAPETITTNKYTNKVDIYSCGITLYEMFENKRYIINEKRKYFYTPKNIRNIIENKMLCEDHNERFSALDILLLYNKYFV